MLENGWPVFSCGERIAQNDIHVNAATGNLTNFPERCSHYFSELAALVASPGAMMGWRKGIIARSLGPNCSMGRVCSRCRVARKFGQPFSFSSIHFLAKLPSRISERILRISSRVFWVMILGPAE